MKLLGYIEEEENAVALFVKNDQNHIDLIENPQEMEITEGSQLVYLGKPIDFEDVVNATKEEEDTIQDQNS